MEHSLWGTQNRVDWTNVNARGLPVAVKFGPNSPTDLLHSTVGGQATVMPYFGVNYRRITSLHAFAHGNILYFNTQSGGECF